MSLALPLPIIYLITNGAATPATTPKDPEFSNVLHLIAAATASKIPLVQIREKQLTGRVLYELTVSALAITRGTATRLIVNDRVDVACAAGASGVQLTSQSLPVELARKVCGDEFIVGVSTHSLNEALTARDTGADFVVFGPVFETTSKRAFGQPQGTEKLRELTTALGEFPVVAIGGIRVEQVDDCFEAGASGVAAIRLLNDASTLPTVVEQIRQRFERAK
jgi:thiamine-phosphate pyrophosphorylase